jgi:hypothetical protein
MAYATPPTTAKLLLLMMALCDLSAIFCWMQQQTQYLHQFVLHASLDAVDEAMWSSKELHLKVSSTAGITQQQQQHSSAQHNLAKQSSSAGGAALHNVHAQQTYRTAELVAFASQEQLSNLCCAAVLSSAMIEWPIGYQGCMENSSRSIASERCSHRSKCNCIV